MLLSLKIDLTEAKDRVTLWMLTSVQNLAGTKTPQPQVWADSSHPPRSSHFGRLSRHRCCILKCRAVFVEEALQREERGSHSSPGLTCAFIRKANSREATVQPTKNKVTFKIKSPCHLFDSKMLWTGTNSFKRKHNMFTAEITAYFKLLATYWNVLSVGNLENEN